MTEAELLRKKGLSKMGQWKRDWVLFAEEAFGVTLDDEQKEIIRSVQHNQRTSVVSGTSRGKDFVGAICGLCFLYLTPRFDKEGNLIGNTKVILSAPTDRQIGMIMVPEFTRLVISARKRGINLPGKLVGYEIQIPGHKEWFLKGFKADENNTEAWSGIHAVNVMFILTEASGIADSIQNAIKGNMQGNSKELIVFNYNKPTGFAAESQKGTEWKKFKLNSLNAPNVIQRKTIIPGQVDYAWVKSAITDWCVQIDKSEIKAEYNDFEFEGVWYRPNDLFRAKVLAVAPKVSEGYLIPVEWIEIANKNYTEFKKVEKISIYKKYPLRLGLDVAGMGRDNSCFCPRFGRIVETFVKIQSGGSANHMDVTGKMVNIMQTNTDAFTGLWPQAFIDTIGEGAGVFSRGVELSAKPGNEFIRVISVKGSEGTEKTDITGQYRFINMRAYLYWAVRDWLNPANKNEPCLPPDEELSQELTSTKFKFASNGKIQIELKDDIKKRIKRSPDKSDALANTFYPVQDVDPNPKTLSQIANLFH